MTPKPGDGSSSFKQPLRTVEDSLSIDVGQLYRRGEPAATPVVLRRRSDWWTIVTLTLEPGPCEVVCTYRRDRASREPDVLRYAIGVEWSPANLGGERAALVCGSPNCARPARRLFLDDPYLKCRRCAGVRYSSQLTRKTEDVRVSERISKVRERLGGDVASATRPKGMHQATYDRLRAELERLEKWEAEQINRRVASGELSVREVFAQALTTELERRRPERPASP